jgi:hypothetical protein
VSVITPPDGARLLAVTISEPRAARTEPDASGGPDASGEGTARSGSDGDAIQAMTRRMDMITAVTRLLLDNSTFSEAVTLQRCARLLAGNIASWVIVDVERAGLLRRQFVIGPHDELCQDAARTLRAIDPPEGSVQAQVHKAGRSVVPAIPGCSAPARTERRCSCCSALPRC